MDKVELQEQILLSVESKSLIQFKCVCKAWNSIISEPNFIPKHLFHTQDQNSQIILTRSSDVEEEVVISLFSSENLEEFQDLPYDKIFIGIDLTGQLKFGMDVLCCNHLLCLQPCFNDEIILMNLNPKETEFKILPGCYLPVYPPYGNSVIGFGFDSNTSDYKVVRIFTNYGRHMPYIMQIEIYSLMSNSWRKLDNIPQIDFITFDVGNMYVNGMFYWYGRTPGKRQGLWSFDLSTELFDFTPFRVTDGTFNIPDANIFLLYDRPGMILTRHLDSIRVFDVLVLLEHGVEESWTKLYSIRPLPEIRKYPVLGCWENWKLFMQSEDGVLYLYELITDEFSRLITAKNFCFRMLKYIDSEQNSKFKILKLKDKNMAAEDD